MQIKTVFSAEHDDTGSAHRSVEYSPSPSADIHHFTSALAQPTPLAATTHRAERTSLLADASDALAHSTERMGKSLRALSKKNNERAMRDYPSHLSNTLLLTHILVKGVGKTAQGLDKISNLQ